MPNCFVVCKTPCKMQLYNVSCFLFPLGVDGLVGGAGLEEVEGVSTILLGEPAREFVVWADWVSGLWGSHS